MAVSWLQCVSLQSRPVFEQDESLALPINVRASQVLDPYGVFPHRHVVAHGVVSNHRAKEILICISSSIRSVKGSHV